MNDNGACHKSFRFRDVCRHLGLKHIRTRPHAPRTIGKAVHIIQTAPRAWAYAKVYGDSERRAAAFPI